MELKSSFSKPKHSPGKPYRPLFVFSCGRFFERCLELVVLLACGFSGASQPVLGAALAFTTNTYTVGNGPAWVEAADINGDGALDLISANLLDGTLTILTNNGAGLLGTNAVLKVGQKPFLRHRRRYQWRWEVGLGHGRGREFPVCVHQ